jgi:hypothetical protein
MVYHNQNAEFRKWQRAHFDKGLYINRKGAAEHHMLHRANCIHLPETDFDKQGELSVTRIAKEVFDNEMVWQQRQKELLTQPKICKTCNPMS